MMMMLVTMMTMMVVMMMTMASLAEKNPGLLSNCLCRECEAWRVRGGVGLRGGEGSEYGEKRGEEGEPEGTNGQV